jgi:hypothetical protein
MLLQVCALPDRPWRGRAGIDDRKARMGAAHVTDENAVVAAQFPDPGGVQLRGAASEHTTMAVAETPIIATMLDPGQLDGAEIGSKWESPKR